MKLNQSLKKRVTDVSILFLASIIISLPIINDSSILKTNDMSGNIVNLVYIKKTIIEHRVFPQWNPYLNQGLPIVADPLNAFFNPVILITFLLFPLFSSIKLTYIISIFLSGLFSYYLLKYLTIEKKLAFIVSFTFMSSGYLAARIYAGHLEKILSYPLGPLLLMSILILLKKGGLKWAGIVALILSLFVYSGAIYETLYAFIILGSVASYLIVILIIKYNEKYIVQILSLLTTGILFLFFSASKVLPLLEISPYILHVTDPFKGSQTFISLLYNLFLPYKKLYSLFGIQNFNPNTPYFWWESYAYIGVLPLICLFLLPLVIKKVTTNEIKILVFLFFSVVIFSMLGNPLNPFTWIFNNVPFLQQFRIPSRIFIFLIPLLLTLSAITLNYFYITGRRKTKFIIMFALIINLASVYQAFTFKIDKDFFVYSPPVSDLQDLLNNVKHLDNSYYFIGQSQFSTDGVPILPSINNEQKIYNHNYGYVLKKSYSLNPDSYLAISPKYFIFPKSSMPPSHFIYKLIYEGARGSKLYRNNTYTAYADIYSGSATKLKNVFKENTNIKYVRLKPNEISMRVNSTSANNTLLVLESFAPGWSVKVDHKVNAKLIKNDFLNITLERGNHTYTFTYSSKPFINGLTISILSVILWIICLMRLPQAILRTTIRKFLYLDC